MTTATTTQRPTLQAVTEKLLAQFRLAVIPAAREFVEGRSSALQLREAWRPYYLQQFREYDAALLADWREASGTDGGLEPGPPTADPRFEPQLRHFPVSIAHHNTDRLIDVMAVELGQRRVTETGLPERMADFACIIDELEKLMASLA